MKLSPLVSHFVIFWKKKKKSQTHEWLFKIGSELGVHSCSLGQRQLFETDKPTFCRLNTTEVFFVCFVFFTLEVRNGSHRPVGVSELQAVWGAESTEHWARQGGGPQVEGFHRPGLDAATALLITQPRGQGHHTGAGDWIQLCSQQEEEAGPVSSLVPPTPSVPSWARNKWSNRHFWNRSLLADCLNLWFDPAKPFDDASWLVHI